MFRFLLFYGPLWVIIVAVAVLFVHIMITVYQIKARVLSLQQRSAKDRSRRESRRVATPPAG